MKPKMSEAEFQRQVIALAKLCGWRVAHFRPGMNRRGDWQTAVQGDPGFPDLVLARKGTILIVELKTDKGRLTLGQEDWIAALRPTAGMCWRPADWARIQVILGRDPGR